MRNFVGLRAIPEMEYHRPIALEQALKLLSELKEGCKIIAGGTDLVPAARRGRMSSSGHIHIIDISSIKALDYIIKEDDMIRIGAVTKLSEVGASTVVKEHVPILANAASQMGSLQVRNLGTIGGNLCNASPAADTAPPLLALDARVNIRGIDKQRLVPLKEFFAGPGETILASGEILAEVQIPITEPAAGSCFIKLGRRNAFTLSIVSVATLVKVKDGIFDDVRIALGAVAPTPIRASKAEEYLTGKKVSEQVIDDGAKVVTSEVKPISDVRASARYRKDMSYIVTKRALTMCFNGSQVTGFAGKG
ncbi:Carbon monoxide dehydrogenase medium chain [subsurface metagenome]